MPTSIPAAIDLKPSGGGTPITSLQGGNDFLCTITLDGPAGSGGQTVLVTVGGSGLVDTTQGSAHVGGGWDVTVAQGSNSLDVLFSSDVVSSNTVVTFTAAANGTSVQGSLTITP